MSITCYKFIKIETSHHLSIVGSVVECSPATRAARVRFPDDAKSFCFLISKLIFSTKPTYFLILLKFDGKIVNFKL